jgi:hypothetical protein
MNELFIKNVQYITDDSGKKISVIIPIKDFKAILEDLEEFEDIKLYDKAKKSEGPSIPLNEAFEIVEAKRKLN